MATNRKLIFAPGETYHIFNRGVDRRDIFTDKKEYDRVIELIRYYRFADVPMRYSLFKEIPDNAQRLVWQRLMSSAHYEVVIIAYCFMSNHFHFLVRQESEAGISRFVSNITNSYTKYFNTKHDREGALLQGPFKAVHIETDEQLLHLTRYIHINPVVSSLATIETLESYPWSSLREYLQRKFIGVCEKSLVDHYFKTSDQYRTFIYDQVEYARELEKIKHLILEK